MLHPTDAVVDRISAAMSIAAMRNQVFASNIANRDAQGYQRMQVRLDSTWNGVFASLVPDRSSTAVPLDQEIVGMSANAGHYESMARALSRYFSVLNTITSSRG